MKSASSTAGETLPTRSRSGPRGRGIVRSSQVPKSTRAPGSRPRTNRVTSDVLPIPGSPVTTTTRPSPRAAASRASASAASASSRSSSSTAVAALAGGPADGAGGTGSPAAPSEDSASSAAARHRSGVSKPSVKAPWTLASRLRASASRRRIVRQLAMRSSSDRALWLRASSSACLKHASVSPRLPSGGEEQLAAQAHELRLAEEGALPVGDLERLLDGSEPRLHAARAQARVGEQAEVVGVVHVGAGRPRGQQAPLELADPLVELAARGECPAPQDPPHRDAVGVAAVAGGGNGRLGPLGRGFGLEAALVEDGELRPSRREAVRAPRVACELHRFAGALEGLIRVTQEPERERRPRVAGDAGVVAQGGREGVVVALLAGKQGHSSLRLLERVGEGALVEEAAGQQLGQPRAAVWAPHPGPGAGTPAPLPRLDRTRRGPRRSCRARAAPERAARCRGAPRRGCAPARTPPRPPGPTSLRCPPAPGRGATGARARAGRGPATRGAS